MYSIQLTHYASCSISLFYCPSHNQRLLDREETSQCSRLPPESCDQPVYHQCLSSSFLTGNQPLLNLVSERGERGEREGGREREGEREGREREREGREREGERERERGGGERGRGRERGGEREGEREEGERERGERERGGEGNNKG